MADFPLPSRTPTARDIFDGALTVADERNLPRDLMLALCYAESGEGLQSFERWHSAGGPMVPTENPINGCSGHVELSGECVARDDARAVSAENLGALRLRQHGADVGFSARHALRALSCPVVVSGDVTLHPPRVLVVLGDGSDCEMIGPNTAPFTIPADDMANDQSIGDIAVRQDPGDLMGGVLPVGTAKQAPSDLTVTIWGAVPHPDPTDSRLVNAVPETLFERPVHRLKRTTAGAERAGLRGVAPVDTAALLTGKLKTHCDLPLTRNRGAGPGVVTHSRGVLLRELYHA